MFAAGVKVMFSCAESWLIFMNNIHDGVVAIDCEGTSVKQSDGGLPLMVQIATQKYVIIELTTENILNQDQKLSDELTQLLSNPNILKVRHGT